LAEVATAAFPTVIAALVSTADTALAATDAVRVVRGFDLSDDPSDVVLIGVPNLSDVNAISAGTFSQTQATMGTPRSRDETGTINCVVMARNGEGDQEAACAAAFGYLADIESAVRSDPALGVTAFGYLVAEINSGDVLEDKVDGATCALPFTVTYKARI
jgi:hypothetical protein